MAHDYCFDVHAVVALHVKADSESEARDMVAALQAVNREVDIEPGVEVTEFSVHKVIELVYATAADGTGIEVSAVATDGPVPEFDNAELPLSG